MNEELNTVNIELGEVGSTRAIAKQNCTIISLRAQVATVFIDRPCHNAASTPAVTQILQILPKDRGRPITESQAWIFLRALRRT